MLKLKLGTGDLEADESIVRIACQEKQPLTRLCVDANSAWQVEEAARIIPRLTAYDLFFVE
ncbi:MAG: hypothetical protein GY832_32835 [Chloroflexi bacterium]|nr:hypothetical protein [Chloroflexota bacterium]